MKTDFFKIRKSRELHKLIVADSLEELNVVRMVVSAIISISALACIIIVWSSMVSVTEVSIADGSLIPTGSEQIISHIEGGTISEINVKESDYVEKGQLLVKFDQQDLDKQIAGQVDKRIAMSVDAARLQAFIDDKEYNINYMLSHVPDLDKNNFKQYNSLIENSLKLIKEQRLTLSSTKNEHLKQMDKVQEQIEQNGVAVNNLQTQLMIVSEKADMYHQLIDASISKAAYLDAKNSAARTEGMLIDKIAEQEVLKHQLQALESKLNSIESGQKEKARSELNGIEGKLLEINSSLKRMKFLKEQSVVTATVDGIVKGIDINIGMVVSPGSKVLEIIPLDQPLIAKVKIRPDDVGYVKIDTPVNVKVSSYNFTHFGSIHGKVVQVSGSTFQNKDDGSFYYEGLISLEKSYFGDEPGKYQLKPGMLVTADILTGEKTILQYMLKPVKSLFDNSFQER